jgi:hypothetical protein
MKRLFTLGLMVWLGLLLFFGQAVYAHEAGAPFSGAIIDPLLLHHAHIENEQRVNMFILHDVEGQNGRKGAALETELEQAWANKKFNFGMEAFIPLESIPSPNNNGSEFGFGDLTIRPVKYALINHPDFVLSTASEVAIPIGSRRRGLGQGRTALAQYLFMDKAVGNWFLGANTSIGTQIGKDSGSSTEYGAVLAYSFIKGTPRWGLAAPMPEQKVVISPSVEFVGNTAFGRDSQTSGSVVPGVHVWFPKSGWQFHAGLIVPVMANRESNLGVIVEVGNHYNWGKLFSRKKEEVSDEHQVQPD